MTGAPFGAAFLCAGGPVTNAENGRIYTYYRHISMADKIPVVTIIGRQNVGKSTLFNALIKERRAIVDAIPGLTRDVLSFQVNHNDIVFNLCDTPGLDITDSGGLTRAILDIAKKQLERSSVIVVLLENPFPAPFDFELMEMARKLSVPRIAAVNKMDNSEDFSNLANFYETGFNEIIPVSALKKRNLGLLLDRIVALLPAKKAAQLDVDLKIAIVGRPNSGKSTLLNSFLGYDRVVVSDVPGTTRDSIDEEFNFRGKRIRVIDTAGLKKKSRMTDAVEYYSLNRTVESIARADVVVHLIDALAGLTETDKKISDEIMKARRVAIIAVNKWDAIEKATKTFEEYRDRLIFKFYRAMDFHIMSISAQTKQRIHKLLSIAIELNERAKLKITTAEFNKALSDIQGSHRLPILGETAKIYYGTQTGERPPAFKIFVNNAEFFRKDVVRFLEKAIQERFQLQGVPLRIEVEGKKRENRKKF